MTLVKRRRKGKTVLIDPQVVRWQKKLKALGCLAAEPERKNAKRAMRKVLKAFNNG
jgi:hypothetical protein